VPFCRRLGLLLAWQIATTENYWIIIIFGISLWFVLPAGLGERKKLRSVNFITGHWGTELTHGDTYLTSITLEATKKIIFN
jgi:hypothetical protein